MDYIKKMQVLQNYEIVRDYSPMEINLKLKIKN